LAKDEQYQVRAGIEATDSQAVRVTKLRKARYRELIKTRLQHYVTATAINILRLGAWRLGRGRGKRDDRLFSHWRSKQIEPDYAELTSSIDFRAQRNKRPARDRLKF
jgi:hypothetical protein